MRGSHGWNEVSRERKREIIDAIVSGTATRGPVHAELDLTDRCNVDCYFCNQQDVRTKEQLPLKRAVDLIDELAETGLRSVRLSGGGDPLFHREIIPVLDHLAARGIIVDNVTTNGLALTADIATRLVQSKAREVIFSLNAADAADYGRMMQVKPAIFDKVTANIRNLIATRGDSMYPSVVVQFLLDRTNFHRMVEMYELGRSLAPDRVAISVILEIPRDRIDHDILVRPEDAEAAEPLIEEIIRRDKGVGLLQLDFAVAQWNVVLARVRERLGAVPTNMYPTAPSFQPKNGGCFFAWYTAAITGNGDIRPCCLLLNPDVKPLGNVNKSSFAEQWNGPEFTKMREEMRNVLLLNSDVTYTPERFQILKPQCVQDGLCWLKNMYFRADEEFYAELGARLDEVRRTEAPPQLAPLPPPQYVPPAMLASHPRLLRVYDWARNTSRPARAFLKKNLGLDLTDSV